MSAEPKSIVRLVVALVGLLVLTGSHARDDASTWDINSYQKRDLEAEVELQLAFPSDHRTGFIPPKLAAYAAELSAFYQEWGYRPAWVRFDEPTPQASSIIALFQNAEQDGLVPEDYDASRWASRLRDLRTQPPRERMARFEIPMSLSILRYVHTLHFGRTDSVGTDSQIAIDGRLYRLSTFVRQRVVNAPSIELAIRAAAPCSPMYWKALEALRYYRAIAARDDGQSLPRPAEPVNPGGIYPGLPRLIRLLQLLGDLPPEPPFPSGTFVYEGPIVRAVRHFQLRHAQNPDGILDAATINKLNIPLSRRIRELEETLEEWRELSSSAPTAQIVVNLPEFLLYAIDGDNRLALRSKVIIGSSKGRLRSPVFEKEIKYVVFRPYWDVPASIRLNEVVPRVQKDRTYIARNKFDLLTPEGRPLPAESTGDDVLARLTDGQFRLRQRPGAFNSLGRVKFVFPNAQNIYMHDTDAPRLFSRQRRDLSHGCIRVEAAAELAAWVLQNNPSWTLQRIKAAVNAGRDNVAVHLERPVRISLVYLTASVDDEGTVRFFDDIYGHTAQLDP